MAKKCKNGSKELEQKQRCVEQLKALFNDVRFKELQEALGGLCFYNVCGMGRQETKHSYFLLNLFDPKGAHGWGSDFARDFLEKGVGLNLPQSFYNNLKTGKREYKFKKNESRVDLLLYSDDTVVLIENKVDAGLHDNQLSKYEEGIDVDELFCNHKKYYIFLTIDGNSPDDDHKTTWHTASYGKVIDSIIRMRNSHTRMTNDQIEYDIFLKHYIKYLRKEIIMNVEALDEEAKGWYDELCKDYPEAAAFLGKQHPDARLLKIDEEISKILMSEAQQRGLYLMRNNGIVGEGRIQLKTDNMTKLLGKQSVNDNPLIYEISTDGSQNKSKFTAYAFARNFDSHDERVKALLNACATYETAKGRKPKTGRDSKRITGFKLKIEVEDMYVKLETDDTKLREIIVEYLDEIQRVEEELEKIMAL